MLIEQLSTIKASHLFHVNASSNDGMKSWHAMVFAFLKTIAKLPL